MFKRFHVVLRITLRDIGNFFKAAGRFLGRILPALVFFTSLMFTFSEPVFASTSGGLVETKPTVGTLVKSQQYSYKLYKDLFNDFVDAIDQNNRRLQKISFLNRLYYFSLMLDNSLNCSDDISSGSAFTNDYLWFYFDFYMSHFNWSDNASIAFFTVANDDGVITDVDDLKFNIEKLSFFPSNWNGRLIHWTLSDPPGYFNDFKNFYNYLYNVYSTEGSLSPGELTGIADPVFSVPDFKDHIQTTNKQYFPKNASGKMSYRTDERFHNYARSNASTYTQSELYVGQNWGFSAVGGGNEIYMVVFQNFGGDTYYSKYQYHFTVMTEDVYYEDRDEVEYTKYNLSLEYWDMLDGSREQSKTVDLGFKKGYSYFSILYSNASSKFYINCYSSYNNFLNYASAQSLSTLDIPSSYVLFKTDLSMTINLMTSHFVYSPSLHTEKAECVYNGNCDMGYVASTTPLNTLYTIDTSKIPNNYYITVSGDTIYDYSITNPETGQKDTIQNYITNNYTFTTNNNGDTNIDNGDHNTSIGGNGGGNGDVNVNVTVNNNIGGGGGSYDMPDTSFFDDYLDDALKESSGIRKFISDFFDSMPGQITKLICIGLVLAILCRLIGR